MSGDKTFGRGLSIAAAIALAMRHQPTTGADVDAMIATPRIRPGEQPTTTPRDNARAGEYVNRARRDRRRIGAKFREEHGRKMSVKDFRAEKRKARAGAPSALDVVAMVPGATS